MSNQINVWGRIVREPDVQYYENGKKVRVSFDIADNYFNGREKSVNYFRCVAFGKRAEYLGNNIEKGMGIYISGRLSKTEFKDQNGITRTEDDILISNFEFTDKKDVTPEAERPEGLMTAEEILRWDGKKHTYPATLSIEYKDKTLNNVSRSDRYFKTYEALEQYVRDLGAKDYIEGFTHIDKSAYSAR